MKLTFNKKPTDSKESKDLLGALKAGQAAQAAQSAQSNAKVTTPAKKEGGIKLTFKSSVREDKVLHGSGITARNLQRGAEKTARDLATAAKAAEIMRAKQRLGDFTLPDSDRKTAVELDESQAAARRGLSNQKFAVLIGAAGTGKTTVSRFIIEDWTRALTAELGRTPNIALVCPTGRAAQQLRKAQPKDENGALPSHIIVDTCHGVLEYAPESVFDPIANRTKFKFLPRRNEFRLLDADIIIVDEGGMQSVELHNNLMKARKEETRVLIMGDINQLAPVSGRSILGFAMLKWPTYELRELHRTAQDSGIALQAHRVLDGFVPKDHAPEVKIINTGKDPYETYKKVCGYTLAMKERGKFDPMNDAVICATNEGTLGQVTINQQLAPEFNPVKMQNGVRVNPQVSIIAGFETHLFAIGDKIMANKNIRDAGITNGMQGIITNIELNDKYSGDVISPELLHAQASEARELNFDGMDELHEQAHELGEDEKDHDRAASHVITVQFADRPEPMQFSTASRVNSLRLSYAFTCHKSQGGEYNNVIVVCHSSNAQLLCREWLYTAMTRAKKRLLILGDPAGLQMASRRQRIEGRTIEEKAKLFNSLLKVAAWEENMEPILPKPVEVD